MKNKDLMDAIIAAAILGSTNKKKAPTTEENASEGKNVRASAKELAKTLYETYLGFMDAGFTSEQAFQLLLETSK